MLRRSTVWVTLAAAPLTMYAGGAPGAEAGAADIQEDKLGEVIVTAQKRSENLQEVPISAQVVGSAQLATQNFNALESLTQTVPGVNITSRANSNLITIRGIGSGENTSFDQSVAMFTDDIYHGRSRMSFASFLDLDHVEVLKGPQSTFFGNNAIAGAFNIVTKKPTDHFEAWGRLLYGMFGQYAAEGAVSGPLTDTLSARLAVTENGDTRGWLDNIGTGRFVPRIYNQGARATVAFRPDDDFDATLKIEGSTHKTAGSAYELPEQLTNCAPPAPFPSGYEHFGVCTTALKRGLPVGIETNSIAQLDGQGNYLHTFESLLTANYRHWDHTFTSVTGFYNYTNASFLNPDQLPLVSDLILNVDSHERYHQFSQELRVTSATGQPLEYLAGLYFQDDRLDATGGDIIFPFFNALGASRGVPAADLPLDIGGGGQIQTEKIYSAFAALTWNITDRLRLNAGGRWSETKKDADIAKHFGTSRQLWGGFTPVPAAVEALWAPFFGAPGAVSLNRSDNAFMPSAGLQYQITPDAMAYFAYSRGFKAGGFRSDLSNTPHYVFGPEHVNSYELGIKSKWLDNTVLVNVDVFRMNYSDLQVNAILVDPNTGLVNNLVTNAAAAVSQGVELEAHWVVSSSFRVGANVTYLHSNYSNYKDAPAANSDLQAYCGSLPAASFAKTPQCSIYAFPVPGTIDLSGTPTSYAPRWSGSIQAEYSKMLPGDYRFVAELSPYATSSFNHQIPDIQGVYNNAYVRLDGRLALESPSGRWAVDLIGKNLTDRTIIAFPTFGFQSKEQPRNVAAQIRFRW